MRLIDADALIDMLLTENQKCITSTGHELTMNMIVSFINHHPTAYNVEKVLIELDEQTNLHNISEASDYWTWTTAMDKAQDIVRRGGVE